jgi:exonuclease SbcC
VEIEKIENALKEAAEYDIIIGETEKKKQEVGGFDESTITELREKLESKRENLKKIQKANQILKEKELNEKLLEEKTKTHDNLVNMQQELKREIGGINKDKIDLKKEIEQFEEIDDNYENKRKELEELNSGEKQIQIELTKLNTERENLEKNIERVNEEISNKKQAKERLIELRKLQLWINDYFIQLSLTIEKHIMSRVYREFNQLLQDWFNIMIEDENLNIKLNDSFAPMVEQNGYESEVQNLSGGEKTSAALAYRLALNKVINDMIGTIKTKDIIILDEPTDGFSTDQLDKMRVVLEELNAKQAIIVSHESKIESFVDNVIKIGKDEHQSRIIA